MNLFASSPIATREIAAVVASYLRLGDTVVLAGEMGAGKTLLAQGICAALGVTEPVTSPTFNLVHTYAGNDATVHHADLYRLKNRDEIADLALEEFSQQGDIVLIEWGDVGDDVIGEHLEIRIGLGEQDESRDIEIRAVGKRWELRWPRLVAATKLYARADADWDDQ
jgi:tRNA threonylcarbamoyladenosine biosynthesis protein TsaE